MKIALLLPDAMLGGAQKVLIELAHELAIGNELQFIFLTHNGALLKLLPNQVPVRFLSDAQELNAFQILLVYFRLCRLLDKNSLLTVVSTGTGTNLLACAARLFVRFGARVVIREACSSKNSSSKTISVLKKLLYRFADGCIGVSDGVAEELAEITKSKVPVISIPNPVDAGKLKLLAAQEDAELAAFPHTFILSVGRLVKQKNFALLVDAYSQLAPFVPQHLVLIGAGPLENAITKQIELLGLQGRVHLLGEKANPHPWFKRADAFVLSSESEGYPNVLLEALAHGLPVVATDCDFGPRQILADGRYGQLVPIGDALQLAEAIKGVLNGSLVSEPWDATAFSIGNIANAYLALLHEAKQ